MAIVLRSEMGEVTFPVRADIADELVTRAAGAQLRVGEDQLGELCAYALLSAVIAATHPDPRPPSPAQIRYALDIARKYEVSLPVGVLQNRATMHDFLTHFGEQLRQPSKCSAVRKKVKKSDTKGTADKVNQRKHV